MKRVEIDDRISVLTFPPVKKDIQDLADAGFKTVINLRKAGEDGEKLSPDAEGDEARESGMEYLHFPISPPELNADYAKRFAAEVENLPGPVAIHCASGRRASLMGLALLAHKTNADAATAAQRGRNAGLEISEADLSPLVDASGADAG